MEASFGSLEPLFKQGEEVIAEIARFHKEGKSHTHDKWEICYVISGRGLIVSGEKKYKVEQGIVVSVPPKTEHWMIPEGDEELKILLVYSENKKSEIVRV